MCLYPSAVSRLWQGCAIRARTHLFLPKRFAESQSEGTPAMEHDECSPGGGSVAPLSGGTHRERQPQDPAVFHAPSVPLSATYAETGIPTAGGRGRVKAPSGKRRRIRLDADAYRRLHQAILERDGWRCQAWSSLFGLEVHHIVRRGRSGDDSEDNLITLCSVCHRVIHA